MVARQIHQFNQDVHKNLRRNKNGIHLDRIENLATEYKRPAAAGFSLVPALLNAAMQAKPSDSDKSARHHHHRRQQVSALPNMQMYPPSSAKSNSSMLANSQCEFVNANKSKSDMIR